MKLLKGKRLESVASNGVSVGLARRTPHDGPVSISTVGERSRERGTLGCVIALGLMRRWGSRTAARLLKAGVRPRF